MGSENGTPTSSTSAPAASRPRIRATVASGVGWPAVMYGTSAVRPRCASAAKRSRRTSDEVVADGDAIAIRIFGLDDGAAERAGDGLFLVRSARSPG